MGNCFEGVLQSEASPLNEIFTPGLETNMQAADRWIDKQLKQGSLSKDSIATLDLLRDCLAQGRIHLADATGSTALHRLAIDGDDVIVKELMGVGADPEVVNSEGKTALDIALDRGNLKAAEPMKVVVEKSKSKKYFEVLRFLQLVPLFARLPRAELPALAQGFTQRIYQPDEVVINQGDMGDQFFVIESGTAIVQVNGFKVAELVNNDYFGEVALLKGEPRNASIKVSQDGPLSTRILTRQTFDELELRKKLTFKKRKAVFAVSAATVEDQEIPPKTPENLEFLLAAFRANQRFSEMLSGSSEEELMSIAEQAVPINFPADSVVIEEDDVKADLFYVLESGSCQLISKAMKLEFPLHPGASFGELALMYRAPRKATITTLEACTIWALSRAQLRQVLDKTVRAKISEFSKVLGNVKTLASLNAQEMDTLANAVVWNDHFQTGDYILQQGDSIDRLCVLYSGSVAVEVDGKVISQLDADNKVDQYHFFGESALLTGQVQGRSLRVVSPRADVFVLNGDAFQQIIRLKDMKGHRSVAGPNQYCYSRERLELLGELGKGAFGLVTLQKDKTNGVKFALKALSKGYVVLQRQEACVANEKYIMRMTDSPFLTRLAATFDGPEHVEFLMEAAMGGELYTVYQRNDFSGNEAMARFFTACAGAGLAHLHSQHIVYRDLKPENILLDARGYGKVADFGLSKFVLGPAYTFCGTPEYFAPEINDPKGYTLAVDWWGLGILAFELMTGSTPFADDALDPLQLLGKVKEGLQDDMFAGSTGHWTEFIRDMLKKDPEQRLPMRTGGFQNFEAHAWFANPVSVRAKFGLKNKWDWKEFYQQKMDPPWAPPPQDENNLDNFDPGTDDPPQIPYQNPHTGWEDDFDDPIGPLPELFAAI